MNCICGYCGSQIVDELEKKRGEKRPEHNERSEKIQDKYRATEEKEEKCNHRWGHLEKMEQHDQGWWEGKKKEIAGTKCAEFCIKCGERI